MYKKFLMLFLAFMISGAIFMSCSSDDDGGTTPIPDPKLSIVSPNGGEILQMGEAVWIHFEDDLVEDVAMYLYKNGDSLTVIDPLITAEDSTQWTIPTTLDVGTDYQIKVVSVEDPSIYDFSDANFVIAPVGDYIIVNSSDGGDIWLKGSTHSITWYTNMTGTVRIDLYKDNMPYLLIYNNQGNDGTQGWTIPNDITIDASADYTLRVQSVENIAIFDESDNFFCISEPNFTGSIIGDWNVAFSKQPTQFYFEADGTITADSLGTTMGLGTWEMIGNGVKIIDELSSTYLLGIVEDNEMDGTIADEDGNQGDWEAERVIPEVLTPNGGQVWMHGTQDSITWDAAIAGNVVISLADTTGIVHEIATVLGSDGLYVWTVPASIEPGAAYLIRIAKEINGEAMDESDHYICISNTDVVDILGDWKGNYTWTKGDFTFDFVNDGTFTWVEGGGSPVAGTWENSGNGLRLDFDPWPTTYFIGNVGVDKIIGTFVDGSSTAIWDAQRLLDITYPNGGEIFELGDIVNITWDDNLTSDYVSIDLYENEVLLQSITASTINDNDYPWTIPNDLVLSTKYNIMITSATSGIYDGCDDFFTINGVAPAAFEYDNFEDGLAQNWTGVEGTWSAADSVYSVASDALENSSSYFNTEITGNYVFEVKARKTLNDEYSVGIIVNGDPSSQTPAGNWENCVIMRVSANGRGNLAVWSSGAYSGTWFDNDDIIQGLNQWNTMKVIVDNDKGEYHFFTNNQYTGTIKNSTFDKGYVGLRMFDGGTAGTGEFDFVSISAINKSVLDGINVKYIKLKPSLQVNDQ